MRKAIYFYLSLTLGLTLLNLTFVLGEELSPSLNAPMSATQAALSAFANPVSETATPSTNEAPEIQPTVNFDSVSQDVITPQQTKQLQKFYTIIGDSRTVQMSQQLPNDHVAYIAMYGANYDWLAAAEPYIDATLPLSPTIIFNLGVNDLSNANKYIEYINNHLEKWKLFNCDVYIMTVNPVKQSSAIKFTNTEIERFNHQLYEGCVDGKNVKYINSYRNLTKYGYGTKDGLHYTRNTTKAIYDYIMAMTNTRTSEVTSVHTVRSKTPSGNLITESGNSVNVSRED